MPDIILKNAQGQDVRYDNVAQVLLTGADTGELIPYTWGDGGAAALEALVARDATGTVRLESSCQRLRNYAFYQCKGVVEIRLPEAVSLGVEPFYAADNLEYISAPKVTAVPAWGFYYSEKLRQADFPGAVTVGNYAFDGCFALEKLQLGPVTSIGNYALRDTAIAELVLTGETVCTLGSSALDRTPIAKGTGYIYVPEELVEAYKSNSGWSRYANQIRAIENGQLIMDN